MNRIFLLTLCLTLPACVSSPDSTTYLIGAANPAAKVPPLAVLDAAAGTRAYTPAAPGDWEKINRAVTPMGGAK